MLKVLGLDFPESYKTYLISIQYADPKMAGLIKEGPAIFGSAYCIYLNSQCLGCDKKFLWSNPVRGCDQVQLITSCRDKTPNEKFSSIIMSFVNEQNLEISFDFLLETQNIEWKILWTV